MIRHDVTALPSRMTYRTPSINEPHLGLLTVPPLVDWIVTRCAWKQLRSAEVQNGSSRVAGSIGDTKVAVNLHFRVQEWQYESNHTGKSGG